MAIIHSIHLALGWMEECVLHKIKGEYWVGDYPLRLCRSGKRWKIKARGYPWVYQWLESSGINGQLFNTRKSAMEVALLALQAEDAPKPDSPPKARRQSNGVWQVGQHFTVMRQDCIWIVMHEGRRVGWAHNLWAARWTVRYLQAPPPDRSWP